MCKNILPPQTYQIDFFLPFFSPQKAESSPEWGIWLSKEEEKLPWAESVGIDPL